MASPRIYGLIGNPVKHSLSPLMHNAAFKSLGINAEYRLFEITPEKLENFLLKEVFSENICGLNITIPYKVKAREILEDNFPFGQKGSLIQENLYYVKLSGAVNTVKREDDKLSYYNTDATGFLRSLRQDLQFQSKSKNVLLIGCGGAGRAIIAALSWKQGVDKIYVNDMIPDAMDSAKKHFSAIPHLKDRLKFVSREEIPNIIKNCSLLINASPLGMKGENISAIDKSLFHKELTVYDIVYNREKETKLIREAKEYGLKVADGLTMLLYQGIDAFELWTGKDAPVEVMRNALKGGIR